MSFPRYPAYKDSGVEWLGKVPAHWEMLALKRDLDFVTSGSRGWAENYSDDGELFIRISNLTRTSIDLDLSDVQRVTVPEGAEGSRTRIQAGDILFSITAYLGSVAVVPGMLETAYVSQHVALARPRQSRLTSRWVGYTALSVVGRTWFETQSYGGTKVQLSLDDVRNLPILAPIISEQHVIADFLDRETEKIDALIAEQRQLIDLLKEKRQAVVSHAVTKGLNPNAPLKPSGIEWPGDVPAHWRVVPLGKVTISRCDGPFGSGLKADHYTDSGVRVIRLQNIRRDGFDGADEAFIDAVYYESELSGHDVISGDVLVAGLGDDNNTVGRACVAPVGIEPAMVKADCFRFRLDKTQVLPAFVATALSASAAADAGVLSSGSTRSRISLSMMATRNLAVPSISEQTEIVSFVQAKMAKFEKLAVEARRAIDLLQERRAALISAAVTGKIDVRELAMVDAA